MDRAFYRCLTCGDEVQEGQACRCGHVDTGLNAPNFNYIGRRPTSSDDQDLVPGLPQGLQSIKLLGLIIMVIVFLVVMAFEGVAWSAPDTTPTRSEAP